MDGGERIRRGEIVKRSDAWKYAEQLAQITRRNTKIVKLSKRATKGRGEQFAFTLEEFPLDGEVIGVAVYEPAK